jgi:PAS domain S-box-containing protein
MTSTNPAADYQRLAAVAQKTTNAVVITDAQRRIVYINEGFTRITGYTLAEVRGKVPGSFLQFDKTDPGTVAAMRAALREGRAFRGQILNRGKTGNEYWLDLDIQPQHDETGKLTGFIAIESDITAQVNARHRLTSIFAAIADGLIVMNAHGEVEEWNPAAERILGMTADQLRGQRACHHLWRTVRENGTDLPAHEHPFNITLTTGRPVRGFLHGVYTPTGDRRWISVSTEPMLDAYGRVVSVVMSFADVTEQRDQTRRTELVVNAAGLGTWDWDITTGRATLNDTWGRMLGYEPHEIVQHYETWKSLVHPDDLPAVTAAITAHFAGEIPEYRKELRMRHKDGSWVWISTAGRVIERDPDGKPLRAAGVHVDCTAAHQALATVREKTRELDTFFNSSLELLCIADMSGRFVRLNPEWYRVLGYTLREMQGRNAMDFVHPDDITSTVSELGQLRNGQPVICFENRYRCKDGQYRWIEWRSRPVGQLIYAAARDVTDRRRANDELRQAKATAEAALCEINALRNALDEHSIISVADSHGKIIDVNTGFCRISGYERDELIGNDHRLLSSGTHSQQFWVDMWKVLAAGRAWRGEVCNRRKDGSLYWVDSTIVPCVGPAGRIEKYVSIRFDITAQKAAEAKLLAAQAEAEAASAAKSEFLANMSHEIRTPMTAILGFTEVLAVDGDRDNAPAHRLECIDTIRRNGEHLLAIINDILDLSKIEAGRFTVEALPIDPVQIVQEVLDLMDVKARAKGLELRAEFQDPLPPQIQSDPLRLRQVLVNLVGNAIKFTETGRVMLSVSCDTAAQRLTIAVADTGIGISDQHLTHLFHAFSQADTSITRKFGGTGLGLRISQRLAEMLGGGITVQSRPGTGSTFTLTIATGTLAGLSPLSAKLQPTPTSTPANASRPSATGQRLKAVRILLAEDGPDNQRLISFHLEKAGAHVTVVDNGRLAVQALTADHTLHGPLPDQVPFDLLISDMQMPELDGYASVRLLRSKGCTLPVLALTAHAMAGERQRCIDAGCNDYATKPIDKLLLVDLCCRLLGKSPTQLANETAPNTHPGTHPSSPPSSDRRAA